MPSLVERPTARAAERHNDRPGKCYSAVDWGIRWPKRHFARPLRPWPCGEGTVTGRDERSDEMIALAQARAQLEIGLSGDANWRALRHGASRDGQGGGEDAGGAGRTARL